MARRLGISGESAGRWLGKLRGEQVVELTTRTPNDPNARYRLVAGKE